MGTPYTIFEILVDWIVTPEELRSTKNLRIWPYLEVESSQM